METLLFRDAYYSENPLYRPMHSHIGPEVRYIKNGRIVAEIAGKKYDLRPGQVVFISNIENHSMLTVGERSDKYVLQLSQTGVRRAIKNDTLYAIFSNRPKGFVHVIDVNPIKNKIEPLFERMVDEFTNRTDYSNDMLRVLLIQLMVELYRFSPLSFPVVDVAEKKFVPELQSELERNYRERFSLDEIANNYHVSKYYLSHLFKSATGYGIIEYLLEYRLSIAKELLRTTDMSGAKIAKQTGFSSNGNFSRYIKKATGMTPMQYRRCYFEN